MASKIRIYEDPRINFRARNLLNDALNDIAHRQIRHGQDYYRARDDVMHELANAWVEHAGKEVADRVVRALHMTEPDSYLTRAERDILRVRRWQEKDARKAALLAWKKEQEEWLREHNAILARMAPHLLPKAKPWQRVRKIAEVMLWIVMVAALVIGGATYLEAHERPNRWQALAECGATKPADYERKCRQFSRTERSTWRA